MLGFLNDFSGKKMKIFLIPLQWKKQAAYASKINQKN